MQVLYSCIHKIPLLTYQSHMAIMDTSNGQGRPGKLADGFPGFFCFPGDMIYIINFILPRQCRLIVIPKIAMGRYLYFGKAVIIRYFV